MQADQSLWPPLHRRSRIPRFLQAPQNAACVLVECGARLGEMRAARGAMKQADTKILFKAGDRARDGRCLGVRSNCSFRKAADLYRSHEHTQRAQIVHFGASASPLRRNVEHSPDQPLPATFGIPARSSVDFERHSNICLRVSQQSFPAAGIGADAAACWVPGYVLLLILIQMEAIYLIGRHTGLRPIRTSNSEIISLQERDIGPRI